MYRIPKQIIIETSSICNLKCKLCPAWGRGPSAGLMDFDLFTSIIDRIVTEDFDPTVIPWMNGESLLHPDYFKMVKYITDRKLRAYLTTNGTIWNEELFQHITSGSSIYQLIFSLDGLWDKESKSIELARPGSDRSLIQTNIEDFIELKQTKGNKLDVCIKICQRGQDWEEIENFISYWLHNGADFVCVGRALDKINPKSMRLYPCQYPDSNFMVIKSDGGVIRCAYNDTAANDPQYTMGSVCNDRPLLEIFNNPTLTKFRELQRSGTFPYPCDTCGFAYTGTGFRGIIYFRNPLLGAKPIHYSRDYYNEFFSFIEKAKPNSYYGLRLQDVLDI